MIEASTLDKSLGMNYYVCDKLNLSNLLEFKKSPKTFEVFEISLDGVKATPELCVTNELSREVVEGYACYVMCKEGVDAFYGIQLLKNFFGVSIGYAGLKDSDSHSCQFISLSLKHLRKVGLKSQYSLGPLKLCFYKFLDYPIRRGYLLGNFFKIFLSFKDFREVNIEELRSAISVLHSTVLPNYYGYQRFGTIRPITHLVGRAIVRGEWDEAIRLIAGSPYPSESGDVVVAREEFELGNYGRAFKLFPPTYWIERRVCKSMMMHNEPLRALNSLPMEVRSFYVEAYQSYLFNIALSNALRALGSVEGVRDVCETLVVPGSNMKVYEGICTSLVYEVMNSEGITCEDFIVRELRVTGKAYVRESTFKVGNLTLRPTPNGVWIEFTLPRGSYASVILREIFKNTTY